MARDKRPVMLPGRQIAKGEKPPPSARSLDGLVFVKGYVKYVNPQNWTIDVELYEKLGPVTNISLHQPYGSLSSYIAAMPEVGSIVLLGRHHGGYVLLNYIPHYTKALEGKSAKIWPDSIKTDEKNYITARMRKLFPGEIAFASKEGMEIFLGKELLLSDRVGNNFTLKSDYDHFISTSGSNSLFASGIWLNRGVVRRNLIDPSSEEDIPHIFRDNSMLGTYNYVARVGGPKPDISNYYTEYLLEVEEQAPPIQPTNEINGDSNVTIRKPVIVFGLGNYVGNNPGTDEYGQILRPVLFSDPEDREGDFSFVPVTGDNISRYGLAYTLFKPDSGDPRIGSFIGIDKEGHYYQFLPSSTGGGIGKGRSMSVVARGSKKEIWGRDSRYGNSWDLNVSGGIRWDIGSHNERDGNPFSNRSIDIRASKSAYFFFGSELDTALYDFEKPTEKITDTREYYKVEKIDGKERREVGSSRETIIEGSDKYKIEGALTQEILGSGTVTFGSGYNLIVGDAFVEKVTKEKQETFGNRRTQILSGGSELVIKSTQGNISEEITKIGNRTLSITTGNIEETIKTGSRSFKTNAGSFDALTDSGNVTLKTKSGQVALSTSTGSLKMGASLNITIKTKAISNVNIEGGTINLKGRTGTSGGVVTDKTHYDYITGAPPKGSMSVKGTL